MGEGRDEIDGPGDSVAGPVDLVSALGALVLHPDGATAPAPETDGEDDGDGIEQGTRRAP